MSVQPIAIAHAASIRDELSQVTQAPTRYNPDIMRLFDTSEDELSQIHAALASRPSDDGSVETETTVRDIIDKVRAGGDSVLVDLTRRFDCTSFDLSKLEVTKDDFVQARRSVTPEQLDALDYAAQSIQAFHAKEAGHLQSWMDFSIPGKTLGQILRPVKRVGVYVPGGHAAYPSTVLMAAIPAACAGVDEIIVCTPPGVDCRVEPLVLAACGGWADRVFRVGGAQAIAAMAYGTQTIPKVDVIVGPGNRFVNTAKRMVYGEVGIDMLAGPSEVCIVADSGAHADYVAADLLAQIEHGPDNIGVIITDSAATGRAINRSVGRMLLDSKRKDILDYTVAKSILITASDLDQAIDLVNIMGPEHLELQVREPMALLPQIRNAGAVLMGDYTGASLGDYVAGPSHTLPTAGTARFSSPLSVATFMKRSSVIGYTPAKARFDAAIAGLMADSEGFPAHAISARIRLDKTQSEPV